MDSMKNRFLYLGGSILSFLTRMKNATIPIKSGKSTKAMPTKMPIKISINTVRPVCFDNRMRKLYEEGCVVFPLW